MRLSRDDESYGDSVSIETQRTILRKYAADNGLHVIDEYVDDGWSGTNFERPSFKRMMADVDAGKVNCIVTKDLSRFGREHVMMDYYLEFVFPEKQIRYIAVTENEDTERGLSDFVPFKNLFNEWFAKDTSRKVKAALHSKFANGERIFAYAPLYGYSPLSQGQIDQYVKMYLPILDLDMVTLVTDAEGELIAVGVTMPSLSRALQRAKGKMFPFGWVHMLKALFWKHPDTLDLLLIAVKPEYQNKGVNGLLFSDLIKVYNRKGYKWAESNPELELNEAVQRQWDYFEHTQHKRRRAYKKQLTMDN